MNFDEFVDQLRESQVIAVPAKVSPGGPLYSERAVESIQVYELVITIEDLAGGDVPPMEIPKLLTYADAYAYYKQLRPT